MGLILEQKKNMYYTWNKLRAIFARPIQQEIRLSYSTKSSPEEERISSTA
jgi:hypothetical protein